ncbi:MAG: FHA domain-containing protein [Planctomycetes bacterium]|nr:FHA domain-containing protein [Planctomycetota bacterium]
MIQGPDPGAVYNLPDNRVTAVGRSSRNSVRVLDPSVSRQHCEIACVDGEWTIRDLDSKEGTLVNSEPVSGRRILTPGDIIRLTSVVFRFDTVHELPRDSGAMVAIREAELDRKLSSPRKPGGSLEDIVASNQQTVADGRQEAESAPARKPDALLLAVVVVVVAAATIGLLVIAHSASYQRDQKAGKAIEDVLSRVLLAERRGNYAAALEAYDELDARPLPKAAARIIQDNRSYTVKLAGAAFETVASRAELLLDDGDPRGAIELYRTVQDRIGLAELSRRANARISEIKSTNREE